MGSFSEVTVPVARPNDSAIVEARDLSRVDVNLYQLMDFRRGQVRRREFTPVGRLEKIYFEAACVANQDEGSNELIRKKIPVTLDWYKTGPLLGISSDGVDLLVCSPMVHPPAIPDPTWKPPVSYTPTAWFDEAKQFPMPMKPPTMYQSLQDRASGILPGEPPRGWWRDWFKRTEEKDFWFVFSPVRQMLFLLQGRSGFGQVQCRADGTGRHTTVLYNLYRNEGHILFGCKTVEYYR